MYGSWAINLANNFFLCLWLYFMTLSSLRFHASPRSDPGDTWENRTSDSGTDRARRMRHIADRTVVVMELGGEGGGGLALGDGWRIRRAIASFKRLIAFSFELREASGTPIARRPMEIIMPNARQFARIIAALVYSSVFGLAALSCSKLSLYNVHQYP